MGDRVADWLAAVRLSIECACSFVDDGEDTVADPGLYRPHALGINHAPKPTYAYVLALKNIVLYHNTVTAKLRQNGFKLTTYLNTLEITAQQAHLQTEPLARGLYQGVTAGLDSSEGLQPDNICTPGPPAPTPWVSATFLYRDATRPEQNTHDSNHNC